MTYDFAIIGAGIVGLAAAREILRARPRSSIIIFEKERAIACHQTGHNSGVIHAGIYFAPGSLRARLCREGAAAAKAFCTEQGIKFETCGKLLVAANEGERIHMDALFERARQNGIEALRIDRAGLMRLEPNITGVGALGIPSMGILDYRMVASALPESQSRKEPRYSSAPKSLRFAKTPTPSSSRPRAAPSPGNGRRLARSDLRPGGR